MDWIEKQGRHWKPRRPSAELRRKLFGAEASAAGDLVAGISAWSRWAVPALGCFLLASATLTSHLPHARLAGFQPPMSASYFGSASHSEMNNIPRATLEWNFGPRAATSVLANILEQTNRLIR